MYEDKDRENMEQNQREGQKVNWTTPDKLEQGTQTERSPEPKTNTESGSRPSHTQERQQTWSQPRTDNAAWRENNAYGAGSQNHFTQEPRRNDPDHENRKTRRAKGRFMKKAAGITAAALLFGVISGGTMVGVNYAGSRLMSLSGISSQTDTQTQSGSLQTSPAVANSANSSQNTTTVSTVSDVSAIVEKAMPSIVAINDTMTVEQQDFFGRTQAFQAQSSGSGIIVGKNDTELLIATNNHVVSGATDLTVTFSDNKDAAAAVKGTDSATDLAIIAVKLSDIPDDTMSKIQIASLGNSDDVKVGQQVIAIGNALGYGQSVTVGYISALNRDITDENGISHTYIQTDAAINPGNSGGALIDLAGNVIGINAAKTASTEVEGMGFAIPISKAQEILNNLMTKKTRETVDEASQGYLGIQGTNIDANTSKAYGLPVGIYIYKIVPGGAAASSDLKEKDIITKFDGQSVTTMEELKNMLTYYEGGSTVTMTVQSLVNGAYVEHDVTVTLGTKPASNS